MKLIKPLNVVRPAIREAIRPAIRPAFAGVDIGRQCYAYNFDGIDDRGVLQNRAINIDGDNTFEFWSPSALTNNITFLSQSEMSTFNQREFEIGHSGTGNLQLVFGGLSTTLLTQAGGYVASKRYGLSLVGNNFTLYEGGLDGNVIRTAAINKGAAREPTAKTVVSCRGSGGGVYTGFSPGPQYDIKINGTLWPMADRNQSIQPSIPAGNNMTLVNTTSDRWEQIPCSLRVTP